MYTFKKQIQNSLEFKGQKFLLLHRTSCILMFYKLPCYILFIQLKFSPCSQFATNFWFIYNERNLGTSDTALYFIDKASASSAIYSVCQYFNINDILKLNHLLFRCPTQLCWGGSSFLNLLEEPRGKNYFLGRVV